MLKYVYVVEYDGTISKKGYLNFDHAVNFIKSRGAKEINKTQYVDKHNKIYKIYVINV